MKKFLPWIILAIVAIGIYSYVKGINNTAVTLDQDSQEAWGNVQTSYQRRNDLIGNLVKKRFVGVKNIMLLNSPKPGIYFVKGAVSKAAKMTKAIAPSNRFVIAIHFTRLG